MGAGRPRLAVVKRVLGRRRPTLNAPIWPQTARPARRSFCAFGAARSRYWPAGALKARERVSVRRPTRTDERRLGFCYKSTAAEFQLRRLSARGRVMQAATPPTSNALSAQQAPAAATRRTETATAGRCTRLRRRRDRRFCRIPPRDGPGHQHRREARWPRGPRRRRRRHRASPCATVGPEGRAASLPARAAMKRRWPSCLLPKPQGFGSQTETGHRMRLSLAGVGPGSFRRLVPRLNVACVAGLAS